MRRPFRPIQYHRSKNKIDTLLAVFSLGLSLYVAYVNTLNLQYNKQQAYQSARIANQLSTLNHSNFMYKLNCELNKEKEE